MTVKTMVSTRNLWIVLWGAIYLVSWKVDCFLLFSNRGIQVIGNQYYRFLTGLFVHVNFFHFLINAVTVYCVFYFLGGKINEIKLLVFSIVAGCLTNVVFSILYPNSESVGGSPVVFGLLALLAVLQICSPDLLRFRWKTIYGQWIIGYAVLSNIPIFSKDGSTLTIHLIAFLLAFLLGFVGRKTEILT